MSRIAVDASVALAWHFLDENAEAVEELAHVAAGRGLIVPAHWRAEVANGLLMGERRRRTNLVGTAEFIERLALLDIETDLTPDDAMFTIVLPLARAYRLTIYDAIYLELAQRHGSPLATLDRELADAARAISLEVLP